MNTHTHTQVMHQVTHIHTYLDALTGTQSPKCVVDLRCNQGKAVEVQYLFVTTRRALK